MNKWYVIRTNPKCEERATADLEAAGFEVVFPMLRKEIIHNRTKKKISRVFPLFNRYLFLAMPVCEDWYSVRKANGVECVLGVNGCPEPIPAEFIERLKWQIETGAFDERETSKPSLQPGDEVQVQRGVLTGYYLKVKSVTGRGTVKLLTDMFKSLDEVEISLAMVEKAA